MAEAYFDHIVVNKISFRDGRGEVSVPSQGVKGLATTADGSALPVAPQTAPATVTQTAGATYTANEQAMLAACKAQLNSLIAALKTSGHLK